MCEITPKGELPLDMLTTLKVQKRNNNLSNSDISQSTKTNNFLLLSIYWAQCPAVLQVTSEFSASHQ